LSKKTAGPKENSKISSDLNEISQIRSTETRAAASIEEAKKKSGEQIAIAQKESRILYESALSRLRNELEEEYIVEENRVHQESKEIIARAESDAEQTRISASVKIPGAVEEIIKKITGGGA
jgi:vacuolar-type H+-ATPase subunit H